MRPKPRGTMALALAAIGLMTACATEQRVETAKPSEDDSAARLAKYVTVDLKAPTSSLTDKERQMIPLLMQAAQEMDALFWEQAYGDKGPLLAGIADPDLRRFVEINYGPWDRLDGDAPVMDGVAKKAPGANFYPNDMTKEEFEAACAKASDNGAALKSLYTIVRRAESGGLVAVPYAQTWSERLTRASDLLKQAAALAEDPGLRRYLELRAVALVTDDYRASDVAWMEMKDNTIDVVIGPIETYEDQLFGYKAAFEGYVLVKDKEWSGRLARYASFLPSLQEGLPVPAEYKRERPGAEADLNAYDVVFYAGDCNAGTKTIAINLPNDETVQLEKGTRRLQLKNAMKAKFDQILRPIAQILIDEKQRGHVTFDAFFANTMFHEVAHGLGIKNTIDGKGTVRQALKEQASALEEAKADVLGLYMITALHERGELGDAELKDNYVTFVASVFRSIRFGATSAHGRANLMTFNFLKEGEAYEEDQATGAYTIDFDRMKVALNALAEKILKFQGDGDHAAVTAFMTTMNTIDDQLEYNLADVKAARIPVDVVFRQGPELLGM